MDDYYAFFPLIEIDEQQLQEIDNQVYEKRKISR